MLAFLVLQLLGWMVLIGTFLVLLDRLGTFRSRERFSEESMTRLWGAGPAGAIQPEIGREG